MNRPKDRPEKRFLPAGFFIIHQRCNFPMPSATVKFKDMTKYEVARVVGARALQLAMGAPCLVKNNLNTINSLVLAKLEFEKNAIPLSVLR